MNEQLKTIENLLSNPDYEMTSEDDNNSEVVMLAHKMQQELKALKKPKYTTRTYKYKHEEKLCPPAYIPEPHEIDLAIARYAMENIVWEAMHYLQMYFNFLKGEEPKFPYTAEIIEKNATRAIEHWDKSLNSWDDNNEIWDCIVGRQWFESAYVDSLADMHGGDCTAFACTCSRCHAEGMFKIPYTATWSKGEGHKMEREYMEDVKKHRA